jgi:metallo-beta-lactamase family protein
VLATPATIKMTELILRDSARLQTQDAIRETRKRARMGKPEAEPLYTVDEAEAIIKDLREVPYQKPIEVAPGIQAVWTESGHMLGSASIQLIVQEGGRQKRVVFSGDLGPKGIPMLRACKPFHQADMVFLESTYGDRDHKPFRETVDEFVEAVQLAVKSRGKIIVPTFAVGRAQLLTTLLAWMFRNRKVKPFPIFLDSPMAIEATNIYVRHRELFDDALLKFTKDRPLREDLKCMKLTASAEESKRINDEPGPCLIMAGAGMCNGGRVLHHLKQNLWKPETQLLIVGYQSYGSLGRRIIEGQDPVSIHGERVMVRGKVHTLNGFSAHAGQSDLLEWFNCIAPSKPRVVLTHGEDKQRGGLAKQLQRAFGLKSTLPKMGDIIEL